MLPAQFVAANNAGAQLHEIGNHHREVCAWLEGLVDITNGLLERCGVENTMDGRTGNFPAEALGGFQMEPAVNQFVGIAAACDGPAVEGSNGGAYHQVGMNG